MSEVPLYSVPNLLTSPLPSEKATTFVHKFAQKVPKKDRFVSNTEIRPNKNSSQGQNLALTVFCMPNCSTAVPDWYLVPLLDLLHEGSELMV